MEKLEKLRHEQCEKHGKMGQTGARTVVNLSKVKKTGGKEQCEKLGRARTVKK